jgi:general L-amino acid transport system substrate-binding protein
MRNKAFLLVIVAALLAMVLVPAGAQERALGPITERIIERGSLICGVNSTVVGFGAVNDAGEYSGFDIDTCRAVAAAILGDANAVTFRPLTAAERPTVLASGEVDMISRNTTKTLSRETDWGATFAPTTFYDGQGVMARTADGVATLEDLAGGTICTNAGTTTELNITDAMASRGLDFTLQTFQEFDSVMAAFDEGRCDAVTTDISSLISRRATAADPGSYTILTAVLSKEPLGPLSPQNDPQFADIVEWTINGLIQAEEFGITSENVDSFLASENPDIQRFLGVGENLAGDYLGISNDFMVTVIRSVGNYGEIFERHLTPLGVERGVNALWTNGGLHYAPPFR